MIDPLLNAPATNDPNFQSKYPAYGYPNVWPRELPELKDAFMDLGGFIANVGMALAHHCDKYISKTYPDLPPNLLEGAIKDSVVHKGRLLHYFPIKEDSEVRDGFDYDEEDGTWCGVHVDHSMVMAST